MPKYTLNKLVLYISTSVLGAAHPLKTQKMTILTSIWGAQYPNSGQNIQQLGSDMLRVAAWHQIIFTSSFQLERNSFNTTKPIPHTKSETWATLILELSAMMNLRYYD